MKHLRVVIIGVALAAELVGCDTVSPSNPTAAPAPSAAPAYPAPDQPGTGNGYPAPTPFSGYPSPDQGAATAYPAP